MNGNEVQNGTGKTQQGPHVGVDIPEYQHKGFNRHSKPSLYLGPWADVVRRFLLSSDFRVGIQTTCGELALGLLIFVRPLYFSLACLAPVLYYVSAIVRLTPHIGSYLKSAATIVSGMAVGVTLAGVTLTLAHLPGVAYTTFLCVFSSIGILIPTAIRGSGLLAEGIITTVTYIVTIISGQFAPLGTPLWREVVGHLYLVAAAIGIVIPLFGVLVLPSLATDELHSILAQCMQALGHSISGYASSIFVPDRHRDSYMGSPQTPSEDGDGRQDEVSRRRLLRRLQAHEQELAGLDYREFLEKVTDPSGERARTPVPSFAGVTHVSAHRPILVAARLLLTQARVEPPWLSSQPQRLQEWTRVVDTLAVLLTRTAALGSVIEGGESLVHEGELRHCLDDETIPMLRLVYSQLAASMAALAAAVRGDKCSLPGGLKVMLTPSWAVLEFRLAAAINASLKAFWQRRNMKLNDLELLRPVPQVRVLLYVGALTYGILEGMAALESAVVAAVGSKEHHGHFAGRLTQQNLMRDTLVTLLQKEACLQCIDGDDISVVERIASGPQASRQPPSPVSPTTPRRDRPSSMISLGVTGLTAVGKLARKTAAGQFAVHPPSPKTGGSAAAAAPAHLLDRMKQKFSWVMEIVDALLGISAAQTLWKTAKVTGSSLISPRKAWIQIRDNRQVQFFLRYYIACASFLVVTLALSANYQRVRTWGMLYGGITFAVVTSEKVDTSLAKGIFRILGTVIGGTLGYLFMLREVTATNPYVLSVLLAILAFIGGSLLSQRFKYAVVLTMITVNSLVFCQYNPPSGTGTLHNYVVRLVVIGVSVLLALLVELIIPWYSSTSALCTLGTIFREATTVLAHYYDVFHDELQLAAEGSRSGEDAVKGLRALEKSCLQDKIAKPLATLQMSLKREAVAWRRGLLVLPPLVGDMIRSMQSVLDCLAAVELVLMQQPRISGRYSGAPYRNIGEPVHERFLLVMRRVMELGNAVFALLHGRATAARLRAIEEALDKLQSSRVQLRQKYVLAMHTYQARVERGDAPLAKERTPDDQIRFQSCLFAFVTAVDKIVLLSKTLLKDEWLQGYSSASVSRHARVWLPRTGSGRPRK